MGSKPHRIGTDLGEQKVLADINEYGWHVMNVIEDDTNPPWSFTIGLHETWGQPELIIIGRSRATAYGMLNNLVTEIEANRPLDLNNREPYLILGTCCHFLKVNPRYYADYVAFARWYYRGKHFPLYQIVWPSNEGKYPWSNSAPKSFKEWQPVLGKVPNTN